MGCQPRCHCYARSSVIVCPDRVILYKMCQIWMSPVTFQNVYIHSNGGVYYSIFLSFFAVWNLDFFRPLYSPFCIHPDMITLQVLALDYLVAVYPLFLIFITYTAVLLHDRYSIVVKIWRPAYKVYSAVYAESGTSV